MSTDDVSTFESVCPCGKGKIIVTQTMPDHPWVRASQIHYDGTLDCNFCSKTYAIESGYGGTKPRMVRRADLDAKAEAVGKVRQAERALEGAPEVAVVKSKLIALIDAQPSKAAKHRLYGSLGFWAQSYGSFIKGSTDGATLLKRASDPSIIRAGVMAKIPEAMTYAQKLEEIASFQKAASAVAVSTVPTGAYWMQA